MDPDAGGTAAGGASPAAPRIISLPHPLDPLDAGELRRAVGIARDHELSDRARFADVLLVEPSKDEVLGFEAGGPRPARRVLLRIVEGPELEALEVRVDLTAGAVERSERIAGVCPTMLVGESWLAGEAVRADARWQAAMRRRGITDLESVAVDPWPAGRYGDEREEGRRLAKAISYLRTDPADNQHARPIEGVIAFVDLGSAEVLDVVDHGVVAVPEARGRYAAEHTRPWRADLRPIDITQPDGPSFVIDGQAVRWQHWTMRVGVDQHEGIVLHQIAYAGRSVAYRASIAEMVVPYGDPGPMHGWKNAFDASEWGLGKMANSLALGCDCLGEIRYLDATMVGESGHVYTIPDAVCIHEEDTGIGWKHSDLAVDSTEVRRGRRLVVSSIVTAGNYDYGFFWYFHLDGAIEMEVKLTGVVTTIALEPGAPAPRHATRLTPELGAPNHQHLFCARLDIDVDGTDNAVYEVDVVAEPAGRDNPYGNAFVATPTLLADESAAQRDVNPATSRVWRIASRGRVNACGDPTAYELVPGSTPTLLADPGSSIGRRAAFATHNLWVTRYAPGERWPAGDYPNQHAGGAGLPEWTSANRSLDGADVVVWYTFGITHVPRPEDWPVMPVGRVGFSLVPAGFFDANPMLDLPPPAHCAPGD